MFFKTMNKQKQWVFISR